MPSRKCHAFKFTPVSAVTYSDVADECVATYRSRAATRLWLSIDHSYSLCVRLLCYRCMKAPICLVLSSSLMASNCGPELGHPVQNRDQSTLRKIKILQFKCWKSHWIGWEIWWKLTTCTLDLWWNVIFIVHQLQEKSWQRRKTCGWLWCIITRPKSLHCQTLNPPQNFHTLVYKPFWLHEPSYFEENYSADPRHKIFVQLTWICSSYQGHEQQLAIALSAVPRLQSETIFQNLPSWHTKYFLI